MDNGFRWLTVSPPGQPDIEIVLAEPNEPMFSADLVPHVRAEALFKDGCGNWFSLAEHPKE